MGYYQSFWKYWQGVSQRTGRVFSQQTLYLEMIKFQPRFHMTYLTEQWFGSNRPFKRSLHWPNRSLGTMFYGYELLENYEIGSIQLSDFISCDIFTLHSTWAPYWVFHCMVQPRRSLCKSLHQAAWILCLQPELISFLMISPLCFTIMIKGRLMKRMA